MADQFGDTLAGIVGAKHVQRGVAIDERYRKDLTGKRFRIVVESASPGARVGVLGEDGAAPASDADKRIATQIVGLLRDQLR